MKNTMNRKELKKRGRAVLKKHLPLIILCCFLLGFFGVEYDSTFASLKGGAQGIYLLRHPDEMEKEIEKVENNDQTIITTIGYDNGALDVLTEFMVNGPDPDIVMKSKILGHSRGVFAGVVNGITKGTYLTMFTDAIVSIVRSKSTGMMIGAVLSTILSLLTHIFVVKLLLVAMRRIFLEIRIYSKIPAKRFLFLFSVKKSIRAGLVLFYEAILSGLWSLTIIGGIIKHYSYAMVPYITAENPDVTPKQAVTLSRRMMDGHKWEMFKLELSFIGWYLLSAVTFGLSAVFWSNPYKAAVLTEYYTEIRRQAIEKNLPDSELLNDRYLYEKADPALLRELYADAAETFDTEWVEAEYLTGIKGAIAKVFGVVLFIDDEIQAVEDIREKKTRLLQHKDCLDGEAYPIRLFPIALNKRRSWVAGLNSSRYYTIWSLLAMFLLFCFAGWCWEVSLHIIQDGTFVNRGMLHGPWIPIYGSGAVLILVILKLLRKYPVAEFLAAIVLAGIVEYSTSYLIELSKGKRWWDYSGYFLNLNGRVCGEGLLVFGIMGIAVVYLLGPILDHYLRKISVKVLAPLTIAIMLIFLADTVYSHYYPNEGKGITDYKPVTEEEEEAATAALPDWISPNPADVAQS